jgi:hypothetical protein
VNDTVDTADHPAFMIADELRLAYHEYSRQLLESTSSFLQALTHRSEEMKKILVMAAAALVVLAGCSDKDQADSDVMVEEITIEESAGDETGSAVDAAMDAAEEAVDAAAESEAAAEIAEMADEAAEQAAEAADAAAEAAEDAAEAAGDAAGSAMGQ